MAELVLTPYKPVAFAAEAQYPAQKAEIRNKTQRPTAAVVFMHGAGETMDRWADMWVDIVADSCPWLYVVMIPSPLRPFFRNSKPTQAWYNIIAPGTDGVWQNGIMSPTTRWPGLAESAANVQAAAADAALVVGTPDRVALVGFSQGGAMATWSGYCAPGVAVGGVCAIASYIPDASRFALQPGRQSIPGLLCHGDADEVIDFKFMQTTKAMLAKGGATPKAVAYAGLKHRRSRKLILDVVEWLTEVLMPSARPRL
eukprot:TRINITY_DN9456_c0_g1_i1.p1 TRINITY_DN9456_c0_g1~~TRINITY_DN9456_c0_g1_i1.p1  ORF type:complete len:276 (+),score=72.88 TRINITY_DN9456_c0_g1_i1:61-828(+)